VSVRAGFEVGGAGIGLIVENLLKQRLNHIIFEVVLQLDGAQLYLTQVRDPLLPRLFYQLIWRNLLIAMLT
jgi:hypothetical protein